MIISDEVVHAAAAAHATLAAPGAAPGLARARAPAAAAAAAAVAAAAAGAVVAAACVAATLLTARARPALLLGGCARSRHAADTRGAGGTRASCTHRWQHAELQEG
jgi:hypothetical protein